MSFYRTLTRRFLAPAYDRIRGTRSVRSLGELEQSQWWARERIEDLQAQRLQHLVRYVYDRVPYYRHIMNERGISPADIARPSDLPQLPVLTKEDIRTRSSELIAEGFPRSQLVEGHTGGSTGTPLCFVASREGRWTHGYARSMRALEWAGLYPGDRTCLVAKGRLPDSARSSLLEALSREPDASGSILIPRAREARTVLPDGLRSLGWNVDVVSVYETVGTPLEEIEGAIQAIERNGADWVTLTSSSTAERFVQLLQSNKGLMQVLGGVRYASIGPITTKTAEGFGLPIAVEAKSSTIEGLVEALVKES